MGWNNPTPSVSIVLPCYNESEDIRSAIENLEEQSFLDREIIVVDDGSADNSQQIAKETIEKGGFSDARVVTVEHRGLTAARNVGIRESRSGVIFFAECDCTYDPDYVKKAMLALESDPGAAAVCLTGAPNKVRSTIATECIVIENKVQHKLLEQGKLKPFYAWVFKKDALISLGGFDESLFQGEDKDMFRRFTKAGYQVAWVRGIHWWHRRDLTLLDIARKSARRGQSRVLFLMKHSLVADMLKGIAPLWALILGLALLPFQVYVGLVLIFLVLLAFLVRSIEISVTAWDVVPKRRWLLAYPLFILVRNLSAAFGYSIGLVRILIPGNKAVQ
jgi:glycosyltransferase involved in cell wall biosynthesis